MSCGESYLRRRRRGRRRRRRRRRRGEGRRTVTDLTPTTTNLKYIL
jgi:hypothetical protein